MSDSEYLILVNSENAWSLTELSTFTTIMIPYFSLARILLIFHDSYMYFVYPAT